MWGRQAPAALSREKTRYPFYRRLGGLQDRSGQVCKIRPLEDAFVFRSFGELIVF